MFSLEFTSFITSVFSLLLATAAWVFVGEEYKDLRRALGTVFFASGIFFGIVGSYAYITPQLRTAESTLSTRETSIGRSNPTSTNTPKPARTSTSTSTTTPTPSPTNTFVPPTKTRIPPTARPTFTNTPVPPTKAPLPKPTPTVPFDMGMIILQGTDSHKGLETQVQWLDRNGSWHNVENWYEKLDNTGRVSWLVWSKDFNTGPFRWVVYNRDGSIRFASQSFYLPSAGQGYLINMN